MNTDGSIGQLRDLQGDACEHEQAAKTMVPGWLGLVMLPVQCHTLVLVLAL